MRGRRRCQDLRKTDIHHLTPEIAQESAYSFHYKHILAFHD
jgi:hypothetical protein